MVWHPNHFTLTLSDDDYMLFFKIDTITINVLNGLGSARLYDLWDLVTTVKSKTFRVFWIFNKTATYVSRLEFLLTCLTYSSFGGVSIIHRAFWNYLSRNLIYNVIAILRASF